MNDVQLLELVAETDLYGPDSPLPESAWTRAVAFRKIERRIGMDTRDTTHESRRIEGAATEPTVPGAPRRRWSGALVAAVAFVVVLGIVGAVLAAVNLGGGEDVAGNTADTLTAEAAVQTAEAWFAAGLDGDGQGALALLTPELRARAGDDLERSIAFNAALLVTSTRPDCTASGEDPRVVVGCTADASFALDRAVGAPGTRLTTTLTVTPEGIDELSESVTVSPAIVLGPFLEWMSAAHPEEAGTLESLGEWPSVAAAQAAGETVTRYADEYAAYLEANGCSYDTTCEAFGIDSALITANAYAAAERSGDVQAALALLTPQLREGLGAEVERRLTLLPAAGWTRTEGECTETGDASAVVVECVASYVSALDSAIGAPGFETTVTMNVTPDGIAEVFENPTDTRVTPETVFGPFRQWLRDAHPEDADQVGRFLEWSSVEAAEASAAIVLTYADEYASYLDANGCTYDQPCNP